MCATAARQRRALAGLITRKERWGLSIRGWLVGAFLVAALGVVVTFTIYPFFAITHRIDASVLAVEGWVNERAIHVARDEFSRGGYQQIVTTGGPAKQLGPYIDEHRTVASIAASRLAAAGAPTDKIHMAPSRIIERDRTYHSAVALRDWLHARRQPVTAINVITEDVHARRTRLLFQLAFGSGTKVGVIAVPSPDYDATHWWSYSEGVRDVLGEVIAYTYAAVFFRPPSSTATGRAELSSNSLSP
jgi:uncharacterized SAM-binding protein YcdF (DUF218 family)